MLRFLKSDFKDTQILALRILALKILKFLSWIFGYVERRLDYKDKVVFKIDDVTTWLTNSCNTHITWYLMK